MANSIILKVQEEGTLRLARAFTAPPIRLGGPDSDLPLDALRAGPELASIEKGPGGLVVRALGDEPVLLNGQPILMAPLRAGDTLCLGEVRILVELRVQPVEHPAPALVSHPPAPAPDKRRLHLVEEEHSVLELLRPSNPPRAKAAEVAPELPVAAAPAPVASAPAHVVAALAPALVAERSARAPLREEQVLLEDAAPVAHVLPALPASALQGGECVEAELFWGSTRLSVWQLHPGERLVAGTADGCDALLHGVERATILRNDSTGWMVCAPRPLSVSLHEGAQTVHGRELLARGRGQADAHGMLVPLPTRAVAVVTSGELSLRVRRVPLASRAGSEPADWKGGLIATAASLLLVAGMKVLSHSMPPPAPPAVAELIRSRPLPVRSAAKAPDLFAPEKQQPKPQARRDPGVAVARHTGTEGEAGSKTAPRRDARAERKRDDKAVVASMGLLKAMGGGKGASDVFGVALDKGTRDAMGHLTGARVGDARGNGGMGLRSLGGSGGGGDGSGLGLARIGTNGIGGGTANYGEGKGGLKGKESGEIGLGPSQPQVSGHIDPELIRKVVHEHRAQIRTCYETQLVSKPNLAGKLISAWTIDASGTVTEAHTQESNLKDRTVEGCVASKIRTWHFPIPKGGGEVFVTYPFIFTPGG